MKQKVRRHAETPTCAVAPGLEEALAEDSPQEGKDQH